MNSLRLDALADAEYDTMLMIGTCDRRDLPPVLGYMQLLKTLSIKGNPIRNEMVHSNMARGIGDLKAVCALGDG